MLYLTVKETAEKWGLGTRIVTLYCAENRIEGVVKRGNLWLIPEHARRPADKRRRKQPATRPSLSEDLAHLLASTAVPMPIHNPDAIFDTVREERLSLQYEAELSYLRGDFARTMRCYQRTDGDDAARLRACPVAIAATISLGDYRAYTEIDAYLKKCSESHKGSVAAAFAEQALATAAVSIIAPDMAPNWLKEGDFSALIPQARPNALYLRAKYFHCLNKHDAMLAVAQTALALSAQPQGFTTTDIYLRVTCAVACHCLGRGDEARHWLLEAMRLALPHGFITPFAEVVTALGGLIEQCLEREFPACRDAVLEQWSRTWKNWIVFHNQFTKDNITLMLTLREYHLALLVAQRVPYAEIARQHCISVGRLKNIMLEIYEKLYISGREELAKYII
ncbi:MAG: helix-turn-helix transcriptional regulator [Clostridia bacterium]|nr:helix-turn-helix transcriptional regulator [Clostridia bacterium]